MGLLDERGREAMLTLWETVRGQTLPISESVPRKACKMHNLYNNTVETLRPVLFFFAFEYIVVYAKIQSNLNSICRLLSQN